MVYYRTRTYIAADFDHDRDAVEQLYRWKESKHWGLDFTDAHELQKSRDTSLFCTIKESLKERMNHSKTFVLVVGDQTDNLTKGGCQYCDSYNHWTKACARGRSVDTRSYIKYECDKAVGAGINVIVLYKDTRVNVLKCPAAVCTKGIHTTMKENINGCIYWDYQSVKDAFDSVK